MSNLQAQAAPGGCGDFASPGPLKGPLSLAIQPQGTFPCCLHKMTRSKPSFASPPRLGERSTSHALLPARLASVRPGLSYQAATWVSPGVGPVLPAATSPIKIQTPGSTPNPQNGVLGVGPGTRFFKKLARSFCCTPECENHGLRPPVGLPILPNLLL